MKQNNSDHMRPATKTRCGRPKKKPQYDKTEKMQEEFDKVVALFAKPYDDRLERSYDAPSLNEVANKLGMTTIHVRKMLIIAGYYSTEASCKVQELHETGHTVPEIMDATGLRDASIYSYLPYSKGVYNFPDPTLCAGAEPIIQNPERSVCVSC